MRVIFTKSKNTGTILIKFFKVWNSSLWFGSRYLFFRRRLRKWVGNRRRFRSFINRIRPASTWNSNFSREARKLLMSVWMKRIRGLVNWNLSSKKWLRCSGRKLGKWKMKLMINLPLLKYGWMRWWRLWIHKKKCMQSFRHRSKVNWERQSKKFMASISLRWRRSIDKKWRWSRWPG